MFLPPTTETAARHFAYVTSMLETIAQERNRIKETHYEESSDLPNSVMSEINLNWHRKESSKLDQPLNLCLRDQTKGPGNLKTSLPATYLAAFNRPFFELNTSFQTKLQTHLLKTRLTEGEVRLSLTDVSQPLDLESQRNHMKSDRVAGPGERRRRSGWKGLAVCAACHLAFNKMGELNLHYIHQHHDLLLNELTTAMLKRHRRQLKTQLKKDHTSQSRTEPLLNTVRCLPHTTRSAAAVEHNVPESDLRDVGRGKGSPKKGHMCPNCSYCAKWPTELQKHVVVHATSRPFCCIICGNCYKWSWDLGRHFSAVHTCIPNPYKFTRGVKRRGRSIVNTPVSLASPSLQVVVTSLPSITFS